ncbi:MAG: transposase family protein [Pyrinomonadaceae bacterium]
MRNALTELGVMPERDGGHFARSERYEAESDDYIIDGTERRTSRPKSPEKQALHYSGKKKMHADKNVVIINARSKRVGYLSPTYAAHAHDKRSLTRSRSAIHDEPCYTKILDFKGMGA